MNKLRLILLLLCAVATLVPAQGALGASGFRSRHITTTDGLPSDNVQQVFQDSEGYLWFATRSGLGRYDGFSTEVYKSNARNGDILTNNSITALAEDNSHRLWIGTADGLNVFDKTSAELRRIERDEFQGNSISCILATREGRVLIGTDNGLYEYFADNDSCLLYTRELSGDIMPQTTVKSLLEDSRGNIWVGTWNEDLYRIDPQGAFHAYHGINPAKSAHVMFEDSRHRIWIGTWGCGLYMLRNPYEPGKTTWINYSHDSRDPASLSDNIIYSISEDPESHTLWVGTRKGLSILDENADSFTNLYSVGGDIPVREVTSIMCDRLGMMWITMLGQGALALITHRSGLRHDRLDSVRKLFGSNAVQRVEADHDGKLWISLGGNLGLLTYNPADGTVGSDPSQPFSASSATPFTVQSLMESRDGRMFVGTYDGGLFILSPDRRSVRRHMKADTPWLGGDRVADILEDNSGRIWFGGLPGLSVLMPDNSFCRFDSIFSGNIMVTCSTEGADGAIWIGTQNNGIVRIDGSGTDADAYSIKHYTPQRGTLNSSMVTALYCDASGRIWAGTDGSGLSLYNYQSDLFVPVHLKWNLPGDIVADIIGDEASNLWVSSNMGLFSLKVSADTTQVNFRLYTARDGAQDNVFNRNAACKDTAGRMYFGGPHGLNITSGETDEGAHGALPVTISDIKVFDHSWYKMPEEQRVKISEKAPGYTDRIVLEHDANNFSIEFAVLDFVNHPMQHKYAYRLDGFDSDWRYTDVSRRYAAYNNLAPGHYTFRVKASDDNGNWDGPERLLQVRIKPPLWATWWAQLIYFILLSAAACYIYRVSRQRVRRKNERHLRELELAQAVELNKTKLRFFTNITHEWLTPLSIISAVSEQMKADSPENKEYHRIMTASVNRLSRLLQQVLEFRKAESGNLHLRVSEDDLPTVVGNIVDNIMPIMKAKGVSCTFASKPAHFKAWFDHDKIDKILYNLLSNAAKYVLKGSSVEISLRMADNAAIITVADNGPGIPASRLPDLFKRFYEGEHRRFSTSGNGIGLSLTKDLVELHHGTIDVKSTEGVGTEFTVTLPIEREAYAETEIDTMPALSALPAPALDETETNADDDKNDKGERASILVVEDDADLLRLISRLLARHYNVYQAASAEKAKTILADHDINLIISDMMMPGMDGVEFCRWSKGRIESSHIPILLLTANAMEEAEVDAYEAGADGFMPKPFSMNVLLARISNLLRMRQTVNRNFREHFAADVDDFDYSSIDEDFLKKAVDCITAHIDDAGYTQSMFIDEMGVTKSTLFRKLKSLTGLSYSPFVRNIRLKAACRMLKEKRGIRISEVAYAVGFNDPKYFSLCFKNEFGMLPSEYIDRFINNDSPEGTQTASNP